MKLRNLFTILVCLLVCTVLASCETTPGGGTDNPSPDGKSSYWDKDGNGIEDWQEKEVTLTFLTWAYTDDTTVTIDVLMAEEFTKRYPNVHIQFITAGEDNQDYNYDLYLQSLLDLGQLPDVFLLYRLENYLPNNMLANITEMYENDPDTKAIFTSLQQSGVYNGKRYAVPTYIYPQFWVVNKTILADKGIAIPTYDWTWDQMEAIARQANDPMQHIIGLYGRQGYYGEGGTAAYQNELPKVLKMKADNSVGKTWVGWAYDGNRFNFDDPVFLEAMNKATTGLTEGWLQTWLPAEKKLEYYNDEAFVPTTGGKVAVWREASWSFKDEISKIGDNFEWDVYPGPSGVTGGNTDIIGISSLCQNKQAAYQFMKWMSYSEEGILTRFKIFAESGSELYQQGNNYPYPIADYGLNSMGVNEIWDNIPYGTTAPGLVSPQYLEALRNGAYCLNKEVCGWDNVDYQVGGYFTEIFAGTNNFAALRDSIQKTATAALAETRAALDIYVK